MRVLLYLTFFTFSSYFFAMDAVWTHEEDTVIISPFTNLVHQRYYVIARLKQLHELLQLFEHNTEALTDFQNSIEHIDIKHPVMREVIGQIRTCHTVAPLLALWQQLCTYKYVEDRDIIDEYSTVLCMIVHSLLFWIKNGLSETKRDAFHALWRHWRSPNAYEQAPITTHEVSYRYYILKRLKKVQVLFKQCQNYECNVQSINKVNKYSHPRIITCLNQMRETENFKPVLALFDDITQFQAIEDLDLIYETLQLVLAIEQQILLPDSLHRNRDLFAIDYDETEELSIEELLQSIDILTTHIVRYIEAEQVTSSYVFNYFTSLVIGTLTVTLLYFYP